GRPHRHWCHGSGGGRGCEAGRARGHGAAGAGRTVVRHVPRLPGPGGRVRRGGRAAGGLAMSAPAYPARARSRVTAGLRVLDRPLTSYYLVLGLSLLLLALGLVMVLSTSSAQALIYGGSPYAGLQKQLLGVAIGLPLMWLAARSSPTLFRALAYPMMAVSFLGLILVLSVGETVGGAERWVQIGGLQIQPSEFAKLAFLLWGA